MTETSIATASVRVSEIRKHPGSLTKLISSIKQDGLHQPITVWSDGTLISGFRRLRSHLVMGRDTIPAVFVSTIEEAAKRLRLDLEDDTCAVPMKWSEVCTLWHLLRTLDTPACAKRLDEARRRGVELRRLTQAGQRPPGRRKRPSEDYALTVISEPFGISVQTARRVEVVWQTANGVIDAPERRTKAREIMQAIDSGESIWSGHQKLMDLTPRQRVRKKKPETAPAAAAAKQLQAWEKSLPLLEGVVAGLVELGPPNPDLTWNQVGPVHTRLAAVRRTLEQQIKKMKEIA